MVSIPADTSDDDRTDVLPPGYRLGRWEVTGQIGSGGWATVYAGRPVDGTDAGEGEEVALKILPTAGLGPSQARKVADTARREVELGRRTGHPRLIRLLESLVLSDPRYPLLDGAIVLVMERAADSLRTLLAAGVSEDEAAGLFTGICEGLAHLHRSGWVHGDLKPDNVLVMADGSVRLSDFGLATELTGTHGTHGYAPPMGTLDYLPPERWKAPLGEHGVKVRPSADIWALGIMIHEAFAHGAAPFPGATPAARGAAVQEYAEGRAPLRLSGELPPFWRELAADCLAPTHAERGAHTAESLLARINGRPDGTASAAGAAIRRRRWLVRSTVLAAAGCGAAAAIWSYALPGNAHDHPAAVGSTGSASQSAGSIRVFNIEQSCRQRNDRSPQCSLGLAIDPLQPYTIDNVVPTRVWHGDVLPVDCRLPKGIPIIDEAGTESAQWFRVRLPEGSRRTTAWLPAVRTQDRPAVPECPRPTPLR
ncbi:serine/threonine-protein kinase [Streptomyces orinoci]|uniref:non-specific serine/threonine protein kinase n=1 Tax=Streptomyces orinoci TaxID=67339 RepID=A0ABV3K0C0_STRON|nr:serine/threonine-protein kinase [Streptomyces orinoci]